MFNFGFKRVSEEEKLASVSEVFRSVASKYNLMNNIMSFGMQKSWKKNFADFITIKEGGRYLDLASGNGDIAKLILHKAKMQGKNIEVVLCDASKEMLETAKINVPNAEEFVVSFAEELPFKTEEFDGVFISFGVRNFTNLTKAFTQIHRILKNGGDVFFLEFFPDVMNGFDLIYKPYLLKCIPKIGKIITGDEESYKYFGESIINFHSKEDFKKILQASNFQFYGNIEKMLGAISFFHFKK
jgi:demethylmenaquinone methyltransferase/2-methoxy-6-polyprenyl-1,4-benzoquinol methylase